MSTTSSGANAVNASAGSRERPDLESQILDAPAVYPFPRDRDALLPWPRAAALLEEARLYWLATARPDGRPHVAPLWGAWLDEAFFFQGAPTARWARNLAANPAASLHLESGTDVVIVDGAVAHLVTDSALAARLAEVWRAKYGRMEPQADSDGIYRLQPHTARAWNAGLQSAARWNFTASRTER